jgi:GNAT superfamily N-acetyltransferase
MNISKVKYTTKNATEEEICSHLKECSDNFSPPLDERVNIEEYSKKLFGNSVTFEAWVDNILIGLAAAYFDDLGNQSGYITNISVTRDYKELGIASELMNLCISYAKQYKVKEIKLEVCRDNSPAIHLYKKFGFMDYKNKDNFILMKLGVSKLGLIKPC